MKYRPDVDGLRAIAILFVLCFHGGLKIFPAGFIGVDIFFVISGFLITGIIHESLQNNRFSFIDFYNRRLWRMQPVFICLLIITTFIALVFYLPDDLMLYGKSARKSSLFISNQFFERITSDYFSPSSSQLPLLHTWSLSIEWQCYLILPVASYLLHRIFRKQHVIIIIYLLSVIFFALSLYFSFHYPAKTYYQSSSRIFEFLIGSCVALSYTRFSLNKFVLELINFVAFLLLIYIATCQNTHQGFPNGYAFILCIATGVLIASGTHQPTPFITRLLSTKPLVFVGLISYSLYIWHWPLFALIHYLNFKETHLISTLAFSLIFIVAYLSWRFIEKPTRKLNRSKFGYTLICLFILPVLTIHLSAHFINKQKGYPYRFEETAKIDEQLKQYASAQRPKCLQKEALTTNIDCVLGAKNSTSQRGFMIGDSFSNQYWRFMDTVAQQANLTVLAHATPACLSLPGIAQYNAYTKNGVYKECLDNTNRYYTMIKTNHYDFVIIGQNWGGYLGDKIINQLNDERSYELTQNRIEKALERALQIIIASGAKPVLIKSIALTGNPYSCFFEHIKLRKKYDPRQCTFNLQPNAQPWIEDLFTRMKTKYAQLIIIDPQQLSCHQGKCSADINGLPMYRDEGHINDYAAYHLASLYLEKYKNPLIT